MRLRTALHAAVLLALAAALAGCSSGPGRGDFDLEPQRIGWFAGDEARFTLTLDPGFMKGEPTFTLDRHFAIEEMQLTERGVTFGGDFETKDPLAALDLRLVRGDETADEFVLDAANRSVDLVLTLPTDLRDSEYVLEVKLFQVGWVKSSPFRVDVR